MLPYKRVDRVKKILHKTISKLLYELKEPNLGLVTITDIDLSDNLEDAKLFFSVIGDEIKIKETQSILDRNIGFIRLKLKHELIIKKIPNIKFIFDDSYQRAQKVFAILDKLSKDERNI